MTHTAENAELLAAPTKDESHGAMIPASVSESKTVSSGVSFLSACLIAFAFSLFSGLMSWHFASSDPVQVTVAFLDSTKLAEEAMSKALESAATDPEKAAQEGKLFAQKLEAALDEYSKAGIVVVNSNVVLNRVGGLDITAEVASRVNAR